MSERMNKERAIEILEKIKSKSEEYIKNSQTRINTTDLTPLKNAFVRKQEYAKEKAQALDIAIESLDENERLKKERDYILEKAKAELKDNEWTDVRDRLPKERDYYLVCGKEKHEIGFACYNQDLGVWYLSPDDMHYGDYEIIAWKSLPKPYERKE